VTLACLDETTHPHPMEVISVATWIAHVRLGLLAIIIIISMITWLETSCQIPCRACQPANVHNRAARQCHLHGG
jgi:hypothetical protein